MTEARISQPVVGRKGMLIRKPPAEVFRAFADPAVTTRFWFTKSSGKLAPGAKVRWEWEMFGAAGDVQVKEFQENSRIVFTWGPPGATTDVELKFVPHQGHTFVQVTETGYSGTGDEIAARAIDSIAGFALVLAAAKALLEHGIALNVVADHFVPGLKI